MMNNNDGLILLSDAKEIMTQRKAIENGIAAIENCKLGMDRILELQDSSIFALINKASERLDYIADESIKNDIINSIVAFQSQIIDVRLSMIEGSIPIIDSFKKYIDGMDMESISNYY